MFDTDDGFGLDDAMAVGVGYGLIRHGQDRQTATLVRALNDALTDVVDELTQAPDEEIQTPVQPAPNAADFALSMPEDWSDYIGQEPLKAEIETYIASSQIGGERFPHTLLKSGYPGVGKTTIARLIAKVMGKTIYEIVPPFKIETLVAAAQTLEDGDVVFIDEIHKLADNGTRGAEILLKILEDGMAYMPDGRALVLPDVTFIGATTEDKLPETITDRFQIEPYFQAYTDIELCRITVKFAYDQDAETFLDNDTIIAIADACRGTPRIVGKMVFAAKALGRKLGRPPTEEELLTFLQVEPDGLTRKHIHYLTAMRQYFAREAKDGGVEYIIGEAAIAQILRETTQGIGRIERFLIERGLIDRTPRGRRLTSLGIARAEEFIAAGKGVADVA